MAGLCLEDVGRALLAWGIAFDYIPGDCIHVWADESFEMFPHESAHGVIDMQWKGSGVAREPQTFVELQSLRDLLIELGTLKPADGSAKPRACRVCGCTDEDCRRCIEKTGEPCWWVAADLCSACAPPEAAR